jgi:hypothetical protein
MAALFGSSALGQFPLDPARGTVNFLGRRNVTHVIQVANMGKNAVAAAQNNANFQLCGYLAPELGGR